jgi:UDP-glucuronate 4-epimerase
MKNKINNNYLVTGVAGFIGYFLSKRLLEEGNIVIGIDNLNDYYDVSLKEYRLTLLKNFKNFVFYKEDISNRDSIETLFKKYSFSVVINLAAQAGVRYSIENPDVYIQSNIIGFYNILELCRKYPVKHLIYASSSSVYGSNVKVPFKETDFVDHPVSLYAATKKSNELMAHTYSHLYNIPSTGLRFFTVYGPLGRPDMAYFSFTNKYFNNEAIEIYNNNDLGNDLYRDFTYIDDIIEGIIRVISKPPTTKKVLHRVLNIGNNNPIKLMDFIGLLENTIGTELKKTVIFNKIFLPLKAGDVRRTYASIINLNKLVGFKPSTEIKNGLISFVRWYISYYKKK